MTVRSQFVLATALTLWGLSAAAQASPTVSLVGDTGTLRITNYGDQNQITGLSATAITNPYGAPPLPTITPLAGGNGWSMTFSPSALSSNFIANASNSANTAGTSVQMDGKLDFYFSLDTPPVPLTITVSEGGTISTPGTSTGGVTGGIVISGVNASFVPVEIHSNSFPAPSISGTNWTLTDTVGDFANSFTTYKISIDNTLLAQSLTSPTASTANVTKQSFTVFITTDGSAGGGVPEPASLSLLALGGLALLRRGSRRA